MMQPYYAEDEITLYCGDCIEVLPTLDIDAKGGRVHVITDPPYEAEAHTQKRRQARGYAGAREIASAPLGFPAISEVERAGIGQWCDSRVDGWALVFCQIEAVKAWSDAFMVLEYIRTQIWRKPNGCPQFTGDRPGMGYEAICTMAAPGKKRWNGGGRHGVYMHNSTGSGTRNSGHPTEKPITLMRELISLFTDEGEIVIDPFAGSGTTLRACKDLGRRCIGIEMNPDYCEIAKRRLAQEVLF